MFTLDKLLKRHRVGLEDVEYVTFQGGIQGGIQGSNPENIYCLEQPGNVTNKTLQHNMLTLHTVNDPTFPLHPSVWRILIGGSSYIVFHMTSTSVLIPSTFDQVYDLGVRLIKSASGLHASGYVIKDLMPHMMMDGGCFGSAIAHTMCKAIFNDKSIILGTTFISPFQVLWDMLNSKYEKDEIEYVDFKEKLMMFWCRVLKKEYKYIPDVCQFYYGMKTGLDYMDYVICKWCVIKKKRGKTFVVKDNKHVMEPSYIYGIDWFCLGIMLDRYIETIVEKNESLDPPANLTQLVYKCLVMECPE